MAIFKKKERAEPESQVVEDKLLSAWLRGTEMSMDSALQIPSMCAAVNLIAGKVAALPVKLYRRSKDRVEEVSDYRTRLLNADTKDTLDGNQFKKAMVRDYFLGKGGFAFVNWNGLRIESIHYVDQQSISFQENADVIFKNYKIMIQGNSYYPHEFIRFLRNSKDGIRSRSVLEENTRVLSVAYNTLKYEEFLVASGGNKRGFVTSKRKLTGEAIDKLKKAWKRLYANNSDNVVILNEGLDFKEASNTSVEMQLNENKKTNGEEICKTVGVIPQMISGGASSTDEKNFVKYDLTNVLSDFETALNRAMLLESEKEEYFFQFDISELTKGDIDKRYNAYSVGIEKGFLQTDEIRKKENLPPLGMDFIKLGLQDGLYDPNSHTVYVLNTGNVVNLDDLSKVKEGGEEK